MKKVLLISEIPVWTIKGKAGIEVLHKTLARLSEEYDVTMIAPGLKPEGTPRPVRFLATTNRLFSKLSHVKGLGYLYKYIYWILFARQVKKIVKENAINFDWLYLVGPMASWAGHRVNGGHKPAVSRHFGVAWKPHAHHTLREKVKFMLKNVGYRKGGDLLIVTDDGTRADEFFLRLGYSPDKIRFWRNGVNKTLSFQEGFKEKFAATHKLEHGVRILMTLSRLASWKKVERTIHALPQVLAKCPNTILVIVGDGDQKPVLEKLSRDLGVEKQVIFAGAVDRASLGNFYHMADVFLSMYDYSNAGNPLFEAMQYGKCIITLNNGDTGKFINAEAAVLLERYSPELLSEAINAVLNDQAQRDRLGSSAKKRINETFLDWDERMTLEMDTICSLLNTRQKENAC